MGLTSPNRLETHVADEIVATSTAVPQKNLSRPKIWLTAHRRSTLGSMLLHIGIIGALAGIMVAPRPSEIAALLNARFVEEDADGGGMDFGNADIDVELPNDNANPLPDMVASTSLSVTVLPESHVAMASLPTTQSAAPETTGGAKKGSGTTEGMSGNGPGRDDSDTKKTGKVSFFGKEVQANTVGFVIDASKSMSGRRFQRARMELVNALNKLEPEQKFFVVFYTNQTFPMFFPDNTIELIEASERNLGRVFEWIEHSQVQGGTEPQLAMQITLKLQPDVVFFLSDGDIPFETQGIVKYHNHGTVVHTITFGSDVGAKIMRQIALRNGGEYRFIPDGF